MCKGVLPKYELIQANEGHVEKLIQYKLDSILPYENDSQKVDLIKKFVKDNVPKMLDKYKIIVLGEEVIGCLSIVREDDSIFLDEIYIDENYRCRGVGEDIIRNILNKGKKVSLWVYKENKKAIRFYKKLGFVIRDEDEQRVYMESLGGSDE